MSTITELIIQKGKALQEQIARSFNITIEGEPVEIQATAKRGIAKEQIAKAREYIATLKAAKQAFSGTTKKPGEIETPKKLAKEIHQAFCDREKEELGKVDSLIATQESYMKPYLLRVQKAETHWNKMKQRTADRKAQASRDKLYAEELERKRLAKEEADRKAAELAAIESSNTPVAEKIDAIEVARQEVAKAQEAVKEMPIIPEIVIQAKSKVSVKNEVTITISNEADAIAYFLENDKSILNIEISKQKFQEWKKANLISIEAGKFPFLKVSSDIKVK